MRGLLFHKSPFYVSTPGSRDIFDIDCWVLNRILIYGMQDLYLQAPYKFVELQDLAKLFRQDVGAECLVLAFVPCQCLQLGKSLKCETWKGMLTNIRNLHLHYNLKYDFSCRNSLRSPRCRQRPMLRLWRWKESPRRLERRNFLFPWTAISCLWRFGTSWTQWSGATCLLSISTRFGTFRIAQ